jgi:hypothetical protein
MHPSARAAIILTSQHHDFRRAQAVDLTVLYPLKEGPAPVIRRRAFGLVPMARTYLVFGDIEGKLDEASSGCATNPC